MKLREILEPEDLAAMLAKLFEKSGKFWEVEADGMSVSLTSKADVEAQVHVIGDKHYLLYVKGDTKSIDMGNFDSVEDIIKVIEDIDRDVDYWMKENDPTYKNRYDDDDDVEADDDEDY